MEELLQILVIGIFFEVSGNCDLVSVGSRGVVSNGVVKLSQTGDSDL